MTANYLFCVKLRRAGESTIYMYITLFLYLRKPTIEIIKP